MTHTTDAPIITHITSRAEWQAAQTQGVYRAASLQTEGFIHCSTLAQVAATANRFFASQRGLVLLVIDPARITAELRYERGQDVDDLFPHLYGPLNVEAVIRVSAFEPDAQGRFHLPSDLLTSDG
jgi:uncharacterized protein (DUF952 family)